MGIIGADPNELLRFADELRRRRLSIDGAMQRLGRAVAEADWVGPDRERFLHEWGGTHAPALQTLLRELDTAATTVGRQAAAQRDVSGA